MIDFIINMMWISLAIGIVFCIGFAINIYNEVTENEKAIALIESQLNSAHEELQKSWKAIYNNNTTGDWHATLEDLEEAAHFHDSTVKSVIHGDRHDGAETHETMSMKKARRDNRETIKLIKQLEKEEIKARKEFD